ncbi:hypothetical protein [Bacillus suaedaesalsae]|uniref:YtzI protein n=1 Tax=Bacillus suaedaesalsae TaxID=2810349 RepID=A0ABS2DK91_9BACI|nr:hypothetical protein [Bacillus suaedaesalsae]MBM6617936.1 hypothetical protein [Bacillus suaedaesalsae]
MSALGYIFWGAIITIIATGFILEKKFKSKPPEKSQNQLQSEHISYQNHHSHHNPPGGGGQM